MNPIEKAVAPLRKDAIERARQEAEAMIERIRTALVDADWDINKAAPYPSRHSGTSDYYVARARYQRFHAVTIEDPSKGYQANNGTRPYFVVMDEARAGRYIEMCKESAAADYDSFVIKLVAKIGEVKTAKLTGNHVWASSTLIVVLPDDTKQAWATKQIMNYSKHGKPFNQWPTRKLKKVPEEAHARAA